MNWPFQDPPNVAVFTTKEIAERTQCIQYVCHDQEDGAWQFHSIDGAPASEADARLVSLRSILEMDPTIRALADLPLGWCAMRDTEKSEWQRRPNREKGSS